MVTSKDVQEIVSKLSSDKAKAREEGIKLLNMWLEGERSIGFCKFLGLNAAKLKPNEIPQSETWPFLIKLLTQFVISEITTSKRRSPKLILAKTFLIVIQRAEDTKFSGNMLPLLSVVKSLFSHIFNVLKNVPSFQSEYGIILQNLLVVRDYRFHIKKDIFSEGGYLLQHPDASFSSGKPPGDFADNLREDIVKGSDGVKDDKFGTVSSSQYNLVELAALVLYRACANTSRGTANEKRVKTESTAARLKEV
ncbi:serine/threonine-protein kinase ATM-like protein [Corchorus olitorius]|uniref:Serine/threonine-protein kinase ATM-like protein n=1 Tax=Corchorus olitorius TaxID=93759 RepID=A0A1R3H9T5_9ROSI|nr:serine/threonine-protein kinase ATM-like protein [Corchorus olitorius]